MIAAARAAVGNPFPGLRPFRETEQHLFFGREYQVDRLVDKIALRRFLAVVGSSGSGKSSLVNCGFKPALRRGLLAAAGTSWCMVQIRPGGNPIRALACGLAQEDSLFGSLRGNSALADMIEATLRLSGLGLVDIYQQARLDPHTNLLIVVDQLEELFRYRNLTGGEAFGAGQDATAFVRLLLEAAAQREHPIYIALTMRSDFLGDCVQFDGLPEAISEGQYLVPRLTREERRSAVEGPIEAAGAAISPVLLTKLVNDVGDNPDQLSILQHALNRTWARWQHQSECEGPISLEQYEDVGTMAHALDRHAEKAYEELASARERQICERVFKALTDRGTDPRGIRRPIKFAKLCKIVGASEGEVTDVINVFRKPSRSFVMPEHTEIIGPDSVIDISHESLMRLWTRLRDWANEEAESAKEYRRLSDRAAGYRQHRFGLMQDPDLQTALDFEMRQQPTEAWAELYGGGLDEANHFLRESEQGREDTRVERELQQRWQVRWQPAIFAVTGLSFLLVLLKFNEALLPPRYDLTRAALPSLRQGRDLLFSFGKMTLLALPFAAIYNVIVHFGKRLHRRLARPHILKAIRQPVKEVVKGDQKPIRDPAAFLGTTYALWWRRSLAMVIDTGIAIMILAFLIVVVSALSTALRVSTSSSDSVLLLYYPLWFAAVCCYHAFTIGSRWQATAGMLTVGTYVTDLNGSSLSPWGAAARQVLKWVLFPVSFYWPLLYFPAKWLFPKRPFVWRRQWLGDIASKTVVLVRLPAPAVQLQAPVPLVRRMLLLYVPRRQWFWVPRVLLYLVLLEAIFYPFVEGASDLGVFFLGIAVIGVPLYAIAVLGKPRGSTNLLRTTDEPPTRTAEYSDLPEKSSSAGSS